MHTRLLVAIVPLVLLAANTNAQPELTVDNTILPFVGQELTQMQYILPDPSAFGGATQMGENMTWDFSANNFGIPIVWSGRLLAAPFEDIPGWDFAHFLFADLAFVFDDIAPDDDSYALRFVEYLVLPPFQLGSQGTALSSDPDGDGDFAEIFTTYEPNALEMPIPTQYGNSWDAEYTESTTQGKSGTPIVGLTTKKSTSVVGWGTLMTPFGSFSALQMDQTYEYSAFGVPAGGGRRIQFSAPVQEAAGKKAAIVWMQASFELDESGNVTEGVFSLAQAEEGGNPTANEATGEIPEAIRLGQNYPNPFNPSTTIPFSIQRAEHVTLTIHDALGREVATIVDRTLAEGEHHVRWDAGGVPSGVYQARLTASGTARSRSLILSK